MNFWLELLGKIWNGIKKIWTKILNFAKNIVAWFKAPSRLRKLSNNTIAVAIKDRFDNGDYRTVKCLFDNEKKEVVDLDVDAEGIVSEDIDQETEDAFGDKSMVILQ